MKHLLLVLAIVVLVSVATAELHRSEFTVRAEGKCLSSSEWCKVKANSQEQLELISPTDGIRQQVVYLKGSFAEFSFKILRVNGTHFYTDGNATFGTHMHRSHMIQYIHIGAGDFVRGPDNKILYSALYRVTRGEGVFKGAAGLITVVGEVTMHGNSSDMMMEISGYLYREENANDAEVDAETEKINKLNRLVD